MSLLARELLRFGLTGTIGFLVDSGILYVLKEDLGNYWARAFSFFAAVIVTWLLNRNFTFKSQTSNKRLTREFRDYFVMMIGGGLVNYGVYVVSVTFITQVNDYPVIGVAAGSLAGMTVNFLQLKLLMFKHKRLNLPL